MTGRGGKRRGRPPKTPTASTSSSKLHLVKKPKYLQNRNDSRFSTPSASRASSPQDSEESSRKSYSRGSAAKRPRGAPRGKRGSNTSYGRKSKFQLAWL